MPQISTARPTSRRRWRLTSRFDRELADREFAAGDEYSVVDITGMIAIDRSRRVSRCRKN